MPVRSTVPLKPLIFCDAVKPVTGVPLPCDTLASIKYSIAVILPGEDGAVGYGCWACTNI